MDELNKVLIDKSNELPRHHLEGIDSIEDCIAIFGDEDLKKAHSRGDINVIGLPGVPGRCSDTLLVYAPSNHKGNLKHNLHNLLHAILLHWLRCPNTKLTHIICPENVFKQLQRQSSVWREWLNAYKNGTIPGVPARTGKLGIFRVTPIVTVLREERDIGPSANL